MLTTLLLALQLAWTPPAGVPTPPIGITEVAPAPTIYVDYAHGSNQNPGTQASPKQTFPSYLPPCTVVQIVGTYPVAYEGSLAIDAHGTAECPVYIRGGNHTGMWEVSGTHLIIENIKRGFIVVRATYAGTNTHDIVIRDSEFVGGGVGVQASFSTTGEVYNVVGLRLNIHDLGNMNSTTDEDVVGFGIYRERNHHIWFLDSRCERVSSDCMQVNAQGPTSGVHHVYAGRITCINNRQGCLWAKQSEDVVFSSSRCSNMRPDAGGLNPGQCFGAQYDARRLWIIKNQMSNSENGVVLGSFDYGEPQGGVVIASNLITNIHHTTTANDINNPWSGGAAVRLAGGVLALVVNNTIVDTDGGVQTPAGGAFTFVANNIFSGQSRATFQDEAGAIIGVTTNGFVETPIAWFAGNTVPYDPTWGQVAPPLFVSPSTGDFRLSEGSPFVGGAVDVSQLEANFMELHGITLDLNNGNLGSDSILLPITPTAPPLPTCTPLQRFFKALGFPINCQ